MDALAELESELEGLTGAVAETRAYIAREEEQLVR